MFIKMDTLWHNDNYSNSPQLQEHEIQKVLQKYYKQIKECEDVIQGTKYRIWQRVACETARIPMLEKMIQATLQQIALSWTADKPDYHAFGQLRNYNDEQIYDLQKHCPDIQSLLKYYQQKDTEQLDTIICKLQDIVDEYQKILNYCEYMISNAYNRSTPIGVQIASYGLESFKSIIMGGITHIGGQVTQLMHDYNKRVASESQYTKLQTVSPLGSALSN